LREYIPPMLQRTSKKQKIPKRFLKIYARWNRQTSQVAKLNLDLKAIILLQNHMNMSKIFFKTAYFPLYS
jgi:hypothetical protein